MQDCNPAVTPMDYNLRLCKASSEYKATAELTHDYQSLVGGIMFAMIATRPDIAFAVTTLSQFSSNPLPEHLVAAKRVLRYLRGTAKYGITYRQKENNEIRPQLHGFCDSDWASNTDDRRSVTGYVFILCGGAVSWKSKKQRTVALSTVEAEYMATAAAVKEIIWWHSFMKSFGYSNDIPTCLYSDSQGSIALAKNPQEHERTKHIDIQYHFIRQHVAEHTVALEYISTHAMAADVMTKSLNRQKHNSAMELVGVHAA